MKIRIQRCNKFHYAEKLGHSAKGSKGLRYCVLPGNGDVVVCIMHKLFHSHSLG